jgi:hypothetical protein
MQMQGAVFDERIAMVSGATTSAVTRNAPRAERCIILRKKTPGGETKTRRGKIHCAEVENCIKPRFKDARRQRVRMGWNFNQKNNRNASLNPLGGLGAVFALMKAVRVCVNVELFDNWPFELKWPRNAATVILHFPAAVLGDRKRRFAAALSALFRRCARH